MESVITIGIQILFLLCMCIFSIRVQILRYELRGIFFFLGFQIKNSPRLPNQVYLLNSFLLGNLESYNVVSILISYESNKSFKKVLKTKLHNDNHQTLGVIFDRGGILFYLFERLYKDIYNLKESFQSSLNINLNIDTYDPETIQGNLKDQTDLILQLNLSPGKIRNLPMYKNQELVNLGN